VDLSRTVWFTTVFPVRLDGHTSPGSALKAVKNSCAVFPTGIGYGVLRYLTENPPSPSNSSPQTQVVFNYLGQVDSVVADSNLFAFATNPLDGHSESASPDRNHGQVLDGTSEITWLYGENIHRNGRTTW